MTLHRVLLLFFTFGLTTTCWSQNSHQFTDPVSLFNSLALKTDRQGARLAKFANGELTSMHQKSPKIGYKNRPSTQFVAIKEKNGQIIYRAHYETDTFGRRVSKYPQKASRHRHLVFFGCSVTFGVGVESDQTFAARLGQMTDQFKIYNYGINGAGPNNMLALVESENLKEQIPEQEGVAIYSYLKHHTRRAIGSYQVYTQWGRHSPYYDYDHNQILTYQGSFHSARRWTSLFYDALTFIERFSNRSFELPRTLSASHYKLTADLIRKIGDTFKQHFPRSQFKVLLLPWGSFKNYDEPLRRELQKMNIEVLDISEQVILTEQLLIPDDRHPNAEGHRRLAKALLKHL